MISSVTVVKYSKNGWKWSWFLKNLSDTIFAKIEQSQKNGSQEIVLTRHIDMVSQAAETNK